MKRTKADDILEKIIHILLRIYYYFYFVTSGLGVLFYFFNMTKYFEIMSIVVIVGILIDLLFRITRNIFGLTGTIIAIIIGIAVLNDIKMGIFVGVTFVTFISSIFLIIFNKILNYAIRR